MFVELWLGLGLGLELVSILLGTLSRHYFAHVQHSSSAISAGQHYLSLDVNVDAEWLSGRMPDSRAREHRHESSYGLHIGAVDGDSLWRCYAMTTQNHCTCTCYFVINRDLYFLL